MILFRSNFLWKNCDIFRHLAVDISTVYGSTRALNSDSLSVSTSRFGLFFVEFQMSLRYSLLFKLILASEAVSVLDTFPSKFFSSPSSKLYISGFWNILPLYIQLLNCDSCAPSYICLNYHRLMLVIKWYLLSPKGSLRQQNPVGVYLKMLCFFKDSRNIFYHSHKFGQKIAFL